MAKKTNPKLIGAFVIGAIVLVVVGMLAFGGGQYFKHMRTAVLFFEGSLAGLDVGSPVTFRGIKVGTVTRIMIEYDATKQQIHIPVFIQVDPQEFQIVSGERRISNIEIMIKRGLRGQLAVQSLVTGQVSVNFDFHPEVPIRLVGAEPGVLEVPTMPSNLEELKASVASVMAKISQLPLDQISAETITVLKSTNELLQQLNSHVEPLADSMTRTSDQADRTLVDSQKFIQELNAQLPKLVASADQVLAQADTALRTGQNAISPDSPLYVQLTASLREIRSSASAIRALADYLQRNPNAVLIGKH